MTKISEQTEELRILANSQTSPFSRYGDIFSENMKYILTEAADTIEKLSARLEVLEKPAGQENLLTVDIQMYACNTKPDILNLILKTVQDTNNNGYAVTSASFDGKEIFSLQGPSKEFFDKELSEETTPDEEFKEMLKDLTGSIKELIDMLEEDGAEPDVPSKKETPQYGYEGIIQDYVKKQNRKVSGMYIVRNKTTGEKFSINADSENDLLENYDISREYFDIEQTDRDGGR